MIGIPAKIWRDGQEETIYLSTRRSGEAGEKMRILKRRFHAAQWAAGKAQTRIAMVMARAAKIDSAAPDYGDQLQRLLEDQEKAGNEAMQHKDEALAAALELVEIALRENHGADTGAILDCLTDKQLQDCVGIIETGDTPEDFFQSRATQPSGSITTPSAGGSGAPSSLTATPAPTSTPAA